LDAIKTVAVANRLDTKFTFGVANLPGLLESLAPHYALLAVAGVRAQRYHTLYFDTPNLDLYLRHHGGHCPRHKVRCRRYVDSDICFLEVKTKRSTGRTIKQRMPSPWIEGGLVDNAEEFLRGAAPSLPATLLPTLQVDFTRLTLVNMDSTERVTIDVNLSYRNHLSTVTFSKLVIAEVKRDRSATRSIFVRKLFERHVREGSISKYCLGIMSLYSKAKRNRFKERLKQIMKFAA
jgi:hypothetical protein